MGKFSRQQKIKLGGEESGISSYYRGLAVGGQLMHNAVRNGSRAWNGEYWCGGERNKNMSCGLVPVSLDFVQDSPHRHYGAFYREGGVKSWREWVDSSADRGRLASVASRSGAVCEIELWFVIWRAVLYAIRPYLDESEPDFEKRQSLDLDTSFMTMVTRHTFNLALDDLFERQIKPPGSYIRFYEKCSYLVEGAEQFAKRVLSYQHIISPMTLSPGYHSEFTFDVEGLKVSGHLVLNYEYDWQDDSPFGKRYVFFPLKPMSRDVIYKLTGVHYLSAFKSEKMIYTHLPAYPAPHLHIVEPSYYSKIVAYEIYRCMQRMNSGRCQFHKVKPVTLHRLAICSYPPPSDILVPSIMMTYSCIYGVRLPVAMVSEKHEEIEGETMFESFKRQTISRIASSKIVVENIQSLYVRWFLSCNVKVDVQHSYSTWTGKASFESEAKNARKENRPLKFGPTVKFNQMAGIKAHEISRDGMKNIMDMVTATCSSWDPAPGAIDTRVPELKFWVHSEAGLGLVGERDSDAVKVRSANLDHIASLSSDYPVTVETDLDAKTRLKAISAAKDRRAKHRLEMRQISLISREQADEKRRQSEAVHRVLAAKVRQDQEELNSIIPDASQVRGCIERFSELSMSENSGHSVKEIALAKGRIQKALEDLTALWSSVGGELEELSNDSSSCKSRTISCNCGDPAYTCDHFRMVSSCSAGCYSCEACDSEKWNDSVADIRDLVIPQANGGFGALDPNFGSSEAPGVPKFSGEERIPRPLRPFEVKDLPVNLHSKVPQFPKDVGSLSLTELLSPSCGDLFASPTEDWYLGSIGPDSKPFPECLDKNPEPEEPGEPEAAVEVVRKVKPASEQSSVKKDLTQKIKASKDNGTKRTFTYDESVARMDVLHKKMLVRSTYRVARPFWDIYSSMTIKPPLSRWPMERDMVPGAYVHIFDEYMDKGKEREVEGGEA
jgi:hypothetical protein